MEAMRDILRGSLGRSLRDLRDEDRLAAAWTVACGKAMAEHGTVAGYREGIVRILVTDAVWLRHMQSLGGVLAREMARISGLRVTGFDFHLEKLERPGIESVSTRGRLAKGA